MNIEEKVFKRHEDALVDARVELDQAWAHWKAVVRASFSDADEAAPKLEAFRQQHGNEALYERLESGKDLHVFGRRHGSLLNFGLTTADVGRRRESNEARTELAEAFQRVIDKIRQANIAQATYDEARRGHDRRAPAQDPAPGNADETWSRRYANRRADELRAQGKEPPRGDDGPGQAPKGRGGPDDRRS